MVQHAVVMKLDWKGVLDYLAYWENSIKSLNERMDVLASDHPALKDIKAIWKKAFPLLKDRDQDHREELFAYCFQMQAFANAYLKDKRLDSSYKPPVVSIEDIPRVDTPVVQLTDLSSPPSHTGGDRIGRFVIQTPLDEQKAPLP